MTDERDDVVDAEALEPLEHSALEGRAVDGVTALAEMSDAEFGDKLQALVRGRDRIRLIKETLMVKDVHYGIIPGTPKPTLYQPGAQLLCMIFGLRATFEHEVDYDDGVNAPAVRCRMTCSLHLGDTSGPIIATGNGAANTWETKHRYRRGERACPECGTIGAIIRGKREFGGGFVCWKKKDGCGAKFNKTDQRIVGQQVDDVENEDPHDLENTIIKMAEKRSYIGATLRGTASSDLFTQPNGGDDDGDRGDQPPHPAQEGPVQQPRAAGQAAGDATSAPGGAATVGELHLARDLFPADTSKTITTSQQGRLLNLASKNGWTNAGVNDEIVRVLSIPVQDIPMIGDAYEAIVGWFERNAPGGGS